MKLLIMKCDDCDKLSVETTNEKNGFLYSGQCKICNAVTLEDFNNKLNQAPMTNGKIDIKWLNKNVPNWRKEYAHLMK